MIITVAICLIVSLAVLANYKALRNVIILAAVAVVAIGLLATGISLLMQTKDEKTIYSAFFSPFISLCLLMISRIWYRKKYGMEIILYMRGLYPVRQEERFVTRLEKRITFLVTAFSVALPILIMKLLT
jgi:hypothetical protein